MNRKLFVDSRHMPAPMNLYSSPEFMEVIAKVYFPNVECRQLDVEVGGQVFRLISPEGQAPLATQTFLDFHEPVARADKRSHLPSLPRLPLACHDLVSIEEFRSDPTWESRMGAPTILWQGFPAWQDYQALLRSRRVVQEDRRRGRRLEELLGPVTFTPDDAAEDVLPACYMWKSERDRQFLRTDLFATDANRRFFSELRARDMLRASTLRAGGQLLAIWLGAVYQQRWSGWVFVFNPDPALSKFSLGRQLLHQMLEESYRAGHREFDFSIGTEGYKLDFATHVRRLGPVPVPASPGRAATALKQWLRRTPWCYEKARAVRHWLAPPD